MDDSEDDLAELLRVAQMMSKRGHASMFARDNAQDKTIVELSTASDWCESMHAKYGLEISNLRSNQEDPPDCYAAFSGKNISLELVELVDGKILSAIQKAAKKGITISTNGGDAFTQAQWPKDRLTTALQDLIDRKVEKYRKNCQTIDVLIVHTDELWLMPHDVEKWLPEIQFEKQDTIHNAFLLMTYDPGYAEYWPVFHLFGSLVPHSK